MIDKLKTYLLFGKNYCGIEHNSKDRIAVMFLQKKKKELVIANCFEEESVDAVCKRLPRKQHSFLIFNTKEVISKGIESKEQESNRLLFAAFPNLKINDFYFEIISYGAFHNISIARKSIVDEVIGFYDKHQISIIGFSLGNTFVGQVNEFIAEPTYATSNVLVTQKEGQIITIQRVQAIVEQEYEVNGLVISSTYLLSFAGALSYILNRKISESNSRDKIVNLLNGFEQRRFFSQFMLYSLGLLLTMLFVNFFLFNSYFEKVNHLQHISQVNLLQKESLLQLKKITDEKQKLVEGVLRNTSSKSSFYIDAIANSLPLTIRLSDLSYQPLLRKLKQNESVEIEEKIIVVSGFSTASKVFSDWVYELEQLAWVEQVTVTKYGTASKERAEFNLKMYMENE